MKQWYQSKTFWISAITILVGALTSAKDVIPPMAWPYIILVMGVLNLVLRSVTGETIAYGSNKDGTPRKFGKK